MSVSIVSFDAIEEAYDEAQWLEAARLIEESTDEDTSFGNLTSEQDAKLAKIVADVTNAVATDKAVSSLSRNKRSDGNSDWTLSTDADGICVEYRKENGKPGHSFAISASVDFSINNAVPFVFEADLIPDTLPKHMGIELVILEERGRFGRLIYEKLAMPPPYRNRYMLLDCQAVDVVHERGGFLILFSTELPGDRILPPSSKDAVRMDIHLGGSMCRVTGPDTTDMCTVFNADAKLSYVPSFVINFVTRKMMWYAFKLFQKKMHVFQTDGLPPQYAERIEKNRERIYDEIPRRLNGGVHIPSPIKVVGEKSDKKQVSKETE